MSRLVAVRISLRGRLLASVPELVGSNGFATTPNGLLLFIASGAGVPPAVAEKLKAAALLTVELPKMLPVCCTGWEAAPNAKGLLLSVWGALEPKAKGVLFAVGFVLLFELAPPPKVKREPGGFAVAAEAAPKGGGLGFGADGNSELDELFVAELPKRFVPGAAPAATLLLAGAPPNVNSLPGVIAGAPKAGAAVF